jgi:glycosyltransferase involved in cell wall biosynthesis
VKSTPDRQADHMRILVAMLSVGFAGTERHAVELANELSRQGHDVAMLLRRRPSEPHRHASYETLRSAISPRIRIFLASRATPVIALWHALIRFKPDIVHAHHERAVRLASRYSGRVRVIGTVHTHFRERDFADCDGLICLTEAEVRNVPTSYRGVVRVIGNWVQPHQRPSEVTLAALRAELGIVPGDYVVGSVARLEPVKGLADLIVAFDAARLPASRLLIVGDGSQRAMLGELAASLGLGQRVIFAGFRHDVRDLYFLFDLFVLNSTDEPYGLAVLEAAASGVPVIAAATAGPVAIAEILPLELVQTGSPVVLAAALRKMGGRAAPAYDMSGFAVAAKTLATVAVYREVLL